MATAARFTGKPLQVDHTPEVMERVRALAEREGLSQAELMRQIIDVALPARESGTKVVPVPESLVIDVLAGTISDSGMRRLRKLLS